MKDQLVLAPSELLAIEPFGDGLPRSAIQALINDEIFREDYLLGWRFHQVRAQLAVLVGGLPRVSGLDGSLALIVLDDAREVSWKVEGWDAPPTRHTWAIMRTLVDPSVPPISAELVPTPNFRPLYDRSAPGHSLYLELLPNAVLGARYSRMSIATGDALPNESAVIDESSSFYPDPTDEAFDARIVWRSVFV